MPNQSEDCKDFRYLPLAEQVSPSRAVQEDLHQFGVAEDNGKLKLVLPDDDVAAGSTVS